MKTATDFTLKDQFGKDYNLFENLNKNVMLVFYPRDNSLVCTNQLCSYNDSFSELEKAGIKIVGINIEKETNHKQFSDKYSFKFPLLSDSEKEVSKAYDALNYAGFNKRKIVVISRQKEIIYEDVVFSLFYQKTGDILKYLKNNKYI